ncbi:MAG: DUF559 domain-containing protein [Pseudolabrys sp.]
MSGNGFRVLRFWNHEVLKNIEGVTQLIDAELPSPPPRTPPRKGEGFGVSRSKAN